MRVAYLCADPGIAYGGTKGASTHMHEVVRALAAQGANVLLTVAHSADSPPPPPDGVTVEALPGPGKRSSVTERLDAEDMRARWLERRLGAWGAHILYERLALHAGAGGTAARAMGIPHVVELNAPLVHEAATYRQLEEPEAARRLEMATLSGASLVLAVSAPLVSHARRCGARKVVLMPNAVRLERFPFLAPAEGPTTAVFAGTLRPWHGVDTIASAWERLGEHAPRLVVVGDGPGRARLETVGAEVTGALPPEAVPDRLASAHIGLAPYAPNSPSYFSPLKLFEYLAAGLAVVAADLPGVSDIVDSETAMLIPPGDGVALAEAVQALAADPARRAALGRAGRARVAAEHTWERRARDILAHFEELSAGAACR